SGADRTVCTAHSGSRAAHRSVERTAGCRGHRAESLSGFGCGQGAGVAEGAARGIFAAGTLRAPVHLRARFPCTRRIRRQAARRQQRQQRRWPMSVRAPRSLLPTMLALAVAAVLGSVAAHGADKKTKPTGTIKDLESRQIEIKRDPPSDAQAQQAIE